MDDRLLRALRHERLDRPPVWFMRQAGRYLPTYRELRGSGDIHDAIRDPKRAADITVLPFEHLDLDAAVLFSDLSTPFAAAGVEVRIEGGVGPVVSDPIRTAADLERLRQFEAEEDLPFVLEAIERVVDRVDVPVIGFVGAPFTLCSYLVEAPRSRNLAGLKTLLWRDPATFDALLGWWAERLATYALAQHAAGASAIQVFDSWAGALAPADYEAHVLPHTRALIERLTAAGVPTIHFVQGNPALLPLAADAGADGVSVDWRLPLDEAWSAIGHHRAIQGNLDPTVLLAGEAPARAAARDVLRRAAGRPGHVFNLGHGVLPTTDVAVLQAVVEEVHDAGGPPA